MTLMTFVYLIAGLVLLVAGAEVLVRGAARLAAQFGIPPLIIGLTVVAFGTSAPETAVSVQAALDGSGDLAIGNVVGSNIANVLLILGVTALVAPLLVSRQLIRLDVPIMIGASLVTYALAWDGSLSRLDGALLFAGVLTYTAFLIISSRREKKNEAGDEFEDEYGLHEAPKPYAWAINAGLVIVGLVLLVGGANFLVEGAVQLARALGMSELGSALGLTAGCGALTTGAVLGGDTGGVGRCASGWLAQPASSARGRMKVAILCMAAPGERNAGLPRRCALSFRASSSAAR